MTLPTFVLSSAVMSAYAALLVAFVAGAFSLLGLTVAKENKVSEFRQEWIDALRDDIADFAAKAQWLHAEAIEYVSGRVPDYLTHLDRIRDSLISFNVASTRIKLRLHQGERRHDILMKAMKKLSEELEIIPEDVELSNQMISELSKDVEIQAASILAEEWKVVKRGEKGYRRAKNLAYFAMAISVIAIALLFSGVVR